MSIHTRKRNNQVIKEVCLLYYIYIYICIVPATEARIDAINAGKVPKR